MAQAPLAPVDARAMPQAALPPPTLGGVSVGPAPPMAGAAQAVQEGARTTPSTPAAPSTPSTPPTPEARPRLNLSLPSTPTPPAAPSAARLLNLVPPPPERKSTLAEGIEKAAKPDCRKAYGGMGALAIIPLAADALREGGCRW